MQTRWRVVACVVVGLVCAGAWGAEGEGVKLASEGRALMPVVVAGDASPRVRGAAETLTRYLGRMSGAKFEMTTGDGESGIALGVSLEAKEPTQREAYRIQSHAKGAKRAGATELAVEHAVWDLLYRLGYRQFFPNEHWEIVPQTRELSVAVNVHERPAYYARRIWYGYGVADYAKEAYGQWCAKNRATSGIELNSGHAYDGILSANKAAFAAHPEYLGLVKGERKSTKFCISNAGLRKLVVEHALRQLEKNPNLDSISMDPSDGGGWCECAECPKLGSVTDRALLLANEVAAAVNQKYPGKLVGIYAYNYHSPPPNIAAHPQVVVSVATAFLKGDLSLDEVIRGWSAKAKLLGMREYYGVNVWDRDLPAAGRGGNLEYLKRTIPAFHGKGARFLSAESSDNWGPNGLGYYLAARMLWDVREAGRVSELVEDFLSRAFGPAREPMREFYRQLDGSTPHLVASDQIGRMFRSVDEALRLANTPEIKARLEDLALYCRYVDLYTRYAKAKGEARQPGFEALLRHAYRMRKTMLVHTQALYRDLPSRDKSVKLPAEAAWGVKEGKNPWKSSEPFSGEELAQFIKEGIERYPLAKIDFKPVAFGEDLVRPTKLSAGNLPPGSLGAGRGTQVFYTRIDAAPATLELAITGGLIAHYRDRGNVRIELIKLGGASQTGERETVVGQDRSVPPDGNEHVVKMTVREPGLYKVKIDDGNDRTLVKLNSPLPWTVKSTLDEPMSGQYTEAWQMCFYVPKGTKVVGLFGGEHGEVRDGAGRAVLWLNGREPNYYSAEVPEGQDGKVWSIRFGRGSMRLLTVPPCFARSVGELLLPAEVVEKDGLR